MCSSDLGVTKGALATAKKTGPFFSKADIVLDELQRGKGTGNEFLTEMVKKGAKPTELRERGIEQKLKDMPKVSKAEVKKVFEENPAPKVEEKVFTDKSPDYDEFLEQKALELYGEDYWKLARDERQRIDKMYDQIPVTQYEKYKTPGGENYREILLKLPEVPGQEPFASSHWVGEPNVLAHIRVQDFATPEGKKVLLVDEIQSDWHQAGRKEGYKRGLTPEQQKEMQALLQKHADEDGLFREDGERLNQLLEIENKGVPDAPFKKNWHELAMKRVLDYAAENGYDTVAITPGAEQAKRYDLSKHIDRIDYFKNDDGTFNFVAYSKQNNPVIHKTDIGSGELSDYFGREIADKISTAAGAPRPTNLAVAKIGNNWEIIDQWGETVEKFNTKIDAEAAANRMKAGTGTLANVDLQVGGEGMKGFYDKMLPDYLNNLGKQYGTSVGKIQLETGSEMSRGPSGTDMVPTYTPTLQDFHSFDITPQLREEIKAKGLPMYGKVSMPVLEGLAAGTGAATIGADALSGGDEQQVQNPVHFTENPDVMLLDLMQRN